MALDGSNIGNDRKMVLDGSNIGQEAIVCQAENHSTYCVSRKN
jgi:hypothetical protein